MANEFDATRLPLTEQYKYGEDARMSVISGWQVTDKQFIHKQYTCVLLVHIQPRRAVVTRISQKKPNGPSKIMI